MSKDSKTRLLARNIGREITPEEIDSVSGASCCMATASQPTSYSQEGYGSQPDVIFYQYDYYCQYA